MEPKLWAEVKDDPDRAAIVYYGYDLDEEDDDAVDAASEALDTDQNYLDIGKDWQALHFLLTGESAFPGDSRVGPPLGNAIMGGAETQFEASYGMVRSLTPEEVSQVADALEQIDPEQLRSRLDVAAFNAAEVYPTRNKWSQGALKALPDLYSQVRNFFREAADWGHIVLISFN